MKGIIFKETEKLGMEWPKIVCLGIVLLWKLCKIAKLKRFARRTWHPLHVEFFNSRKGAEYIKTLNTISIFKEGKPDDTSYNENSKQTLWKRSLTARGIIQLIIKELDELGEN